MRDLPREAQGRTFLFTDGKEEAPHKPEAPDQLKKHTERYRYMDDLQKVRARTWTAWWTAG